MIEVLTICCDILKIAAPALVGLLVIICIGDI